VRLSVIGITIYFLHVQAPNQCQPSNVNLARTSNLSSNSICPPPLIPQHNNEYHSALPRSPCNPSPQRNKRTSKLLIRSSAPHQAQSRTPSPRPLPHRQDSSSVLVRLARRPEERPGWRQSKKASSSPYKSDKEVEAQQGRWTREVYRDIPVGSNSLKFITATINPTFFPYINGTRNGKKTARPALGRTPFRASIP